jgi:hypothetical protein
MRMRSIVACTAALAASISASYGGPRWDDLSAVQAKIDAVLEAKAAAGPPATAEAMAGTSLNRHRVRWRPLRKGWAKYRRGRSMLLGKPWRVRVQPMTLATRPHASRFGRRAALSSLRTTLMASADCAAVSTRPRRRGDRM